MPVDQVADLVNVGWWETVGVGLVVGQLGVDVIVDIPLFRRPQSDNEFWCFSHGRITHDVLQGGGTTEGEVLELGQESVGLFGLLLEVIRVVDLLDMFLEKLQIRS